MATKRFTKKMLGPLDRAELRKIAIVGMGLEPLDAYTMKEAEVVSWIHERAEEFAGLSISGVGIEDTFRTGVGSYIKRLQKFILGECTAPSWPPEGTDEDTSDEVSEEVKTPVEAVVEEPKKKRGRPRKKPEAVAKPAVAPIKKSTKSPKRKATTGFKKVEEVDEVAEAAPADLEIKTTEKNPAATALMSKLSELESQLQAIRQEQTQANNLLTNTLVYIINSIIVEEDEPMIKDLTKVPDPSKYVK
jgi:hypothetical protein